MKPVIIKKMILDILGEADEDLRKDFEQPRNDTEEDLEYIEDTMKQMVFIVQEYLKNEHK